MAKPAQSTARSKRQAPAKRRAPSADEKPILVWEGQEFAEYSRNRKWYVLVGVIGGALTIGALVLRQWLTAPVFALATYVVLRHADDKPRTLTYQISRLGVTVGEKFHPFSELKTYWVVYNPPARTVTFQSTKRFKPLLKLNLEDVDPEAVRATLKPYLPETPKQSEDFLDKFSRFIRL
jgi:hypothetical protein